MPSGMPMVMEAGVPWPPEEEGGRVGGGRGRGSVGEEVARRTVGADADAEIVCSRPNERAVDSVVDGQSAPALALDSSAVAVDCASMASASLFVTLVRFGLVSFRGNWSSWPWKRSRVPYLASSQQERSCCCPEGCRCCCGAANESAARTGI
ncbi:hypothetical protein BDV95DRAFT_576034 [Massariosphaeria phaeospora]|uniref:Uncharacterized protein n=1 Tax=Massariosphaeria phaeospora TaxID=100035 RepID=A0A7C8M423_9PLEO|nr:hypothetical protein BDV95DRAFT_576034 [Massariosphaeria phaeospora]